MIPHPFGDVLFGGLLGRGVQRGPDVSLRPLPMTGGASFDAVHGLASTDVDPRPLVACDEDVGENVGELIGTELRTLHSELAHGLVHLGPVVPHSSGDLGHASPELHGSEVWPDARARAENGVTSTTSLAVEEPSPVRRIACRLELAGRSPLALASEVGEKVDDLVSFECRNIEVLHLHRGDHGRPVVPQILGDAEGRDTAGQTVQPRRGIPTEPSHGMTPNAVLLSEQDLARWGPRGLVKVLKKIEKRGEIGEVTLLFETRPGEMNLPHLLAHRRQVIPHIGGDIVERPSHALSSEIGADAASGAAYRMAADAALGLEDRLAEDRVAKPLLGGGDAGETQKNEACETYGCTTGSRPGSYRQCLPHK